MNSQPFLSEETTTQIHSGYITYYNTEKKFGFILDANDQKWFFHYNRNEQVLLKKRDGIKNAMHEFIPGDQVEFQLRPNLKDASKMVAFNIRFITNVNKQQLIEHAAENKILHGVLFKEDNAYFVKHLKYDLSIPVWISDWEIDLNEVYAHRLNKVVSFTLNPVKHFKLLRAALTDRRFSHEYIRLMLIKESGRSIPARITGKNWRGFFAKILDGTVTAFALMPVDFNEEERDHFFRFSDGDNVMVKIKSIRNSKTVSITIEE